MSIHDVVARVMYIAGQYYKNFISYLQTRKKRGDLSGRITISSSVNGTLSIIGRQEVVGGETIGINISTADAWLNPIGIVPLSGSIAKKSTTSRNILPLNYANGFETGTPSDYSYGGSTISADTSSYSGTYAIKFIGDNTTWLTNTNHTPTTPGVDWVASSRVKLPSGLCCGYLALHWWDSGDTYIGENTEAFNESSYTKRRVTGTAPAGTAYVSMGLRGMITTDTAYLDELQLELGTTPTDYVNPGSSTETGPGGQSSMTGELTLSSSFGGSIAVQSSVTGLLSKTTGLNQNLLVANLSNGFESGAPSDIKTIGSGGGSGTNLLPLNVADGGESGVVTEWVPRATGSISSDSTNQYTGTRCIRLNSDLTWGAQLAPDYYIPISPNTDYVASFYVKNPSSENYIAIMWYDINKTELSYSNQEYWADASYVHQEVTGKSPANAVYAGIYNGVNAPFHDSWMDRMQLEVGTVATAWTAPSTGGGTVTVTADSAQKYSGSYCIKVEGNTTNYITSVGNGLSNIPVTGGNKYTVQARIKSNDVNAKFGIVWTDGNYNILSSTNTALGGTSYNTKTTVTGTAPTGAVYGGLFIQPSAIAPNTSTMYLDELQFEPGDTATSWVEGMGIPKGSGSDIMLDGDISVQTSMGGGLYTPTPPVTGGVLDMRLDYEDVTAYGADRTGNVDCTSAVNAAYAVNGKIYFPSGTYKCNLTFSSGGTGTKVPCIMGEGSGTTTLKANNTNPVVTVNSNVAAGQCLKISDLCLDGNGSSNGLQISIDIPAQNMDIRNLKIQNVNKGIYASGIFICSMIENIYIKTATEGINLYGAYYSTVNGVNMENITNWGLVMQASGCVFRQIASDACIYDYGMSNRYEKITIHDLYNANPPTGTYGTARTAFQNVGNSTVVDLEIRDGNSLHAGALTYGYASVQYGHVIERLVISGSGPSTKHPAKVIASLATDDVLIHIDGGNSAYPTAETYLGSTDLMSCRIAGGGPFFDNWKKRESFGTAAPTGGTWSVGDKVWNTNPGSGGYIGWICTTAGTPGTWKTYGLIS